VNSPMPAEEVQKLLNMRQKMGLSRPGEAEAFCEICGVCHPEGAHNPRLLKSKNDDTIRNIVTEVVQKTLGT